MESSFPIACLVSGNGTNLQAIIDSIEAGTIPARIAAVISNVPGAGALDRAEKHRLPHHVVDHTQYRDRSSFERALSDIIEHSGAKLICLCGFMRILTPGFIEQHRGRIINIHPALLPKFGGKGMYGHHVHQAVLAAGEKVSGCTVHAVDAQVDHGAVILQRTVPVLPGDTADSLAARVLEQEHVAYPIAIKLFAEGRITITGDRAIIT